MTAQTHIDAIGRSIVDLEQRAKALRKAAREIDAAVQKLHELADAAQKAYLAEPYQGGALIIPFSGGTNKPEPGDEPKEPLK